MWGTPLDGYSSRVRVIASRCLVWLSAFSSVLLNKNKKRHKSMAHDVRYPPGWVLKGLYVIASRCLDRLSTFGSVLLNKKKSVTQVDGSWCEIPPGRGAKPGMCFRESVLSATFNIWFSFCEQKKFGHTSGRVMVWVTRPGRGVEPGVCQWSRCLVENEKFFLIELNLIKLCGNIDHLFSLPEEWQFRWNQKKKFFFRNFF